MGIDVNEQRALVFCAHDDDEVIGAGGTIRMMADAGVEVTTVVFATGNEGYLQLEDKESIVLRRRGEREEAQKILGTSSCHAYDYHDFDNLDCEDVYRKVIQMVRLARPVLVLSHMSGDYIAHRTLARIVPEAVWQAGWRCSLDLGEPWQVNRLYQFPILDFVAKPSHVVDITVTFPAKLEAMQAYASQHGVVAGILDQIEAKARAYGSLVGVRYGEAFVRSQAIPVLVPDPTMLLIENL